MERITVRMLMLADVLTGTLDRAAELLSAYYRVASAKLLIRGARPTHFAFDEKHRRPRKARGLRIHARRLKAAQRRMKNTDRKKNRATIGARQAAHR